MRGPPNSPARSLSGTLKADAGLLLTLLGLMWAVAIVNLLPFIDLNRFGIHPRTIAGLPGIVCAPFLHGGFGHLIANSVPFVVLGSVVLLGGRGVFWRVTLFVMLAGGLGVWLFAGKPTNHLGASGLVFGYLGFLLARGSFERSLRWMLAACAVLIIYGGLLLGVLPLRAGVSWQAHLFGFLAGIGAARLLFSGKKKRLR